MKLGVFELLAFAIFLWKCTSSVECLESGKCEKLVDLRNIQRSLKTVGCDKAVSLSGAKSTTTLLRSLVCQCKSNNLYVPKANTCIDAYNTKIMTPMIQEKLSQIIEKINTELLTQKATQNQICEAIQILVDAICNVGSVCVGCALMFHDNNNGQSVEKMTDTCYTGTLNALSEDYLRKMPVLAPTVIRIIAEGLIPINEVYYGPTIRGCFGKFSGQSVDFCECNNPK